MGGLSSRTAALLAEERPPGGGDCLLVDTGARDGGESGIVSHDEVRRWLVTGRGGTDATVGVNAGGDESAGGDGGADCRCRRAARRADLRQEPFIVSAEDLAETEGSFRQVGGVDGLGPDGGAGRAERARCGEPIWEMGVMPQTGLVACRLERLLRAQDPVGSEPIVDLHGPMTARHGDFAVREAAGVGEGGDVVRGRPLGRDVPAFFGRIGWGCREGDGWEAAGEGSGEAVVAGACRALAIPCRGWRGRSMRPRGDQGGRWRALVSPVSLGPLRPLMVRTSLMSLMRAGDTLRSGALTPCITGRILGALVCHAIDDDGGGAISVQFCLLFIGDDPRVDDGLIMTPWTRCAQILHQIE